MVMEDEERLLMAQILLGIPRFDKQIFEVDESSYSKLIKEAAMYRDKAIRLFGAYWKEPEKEILFEMAQESLEKLHQRLSLLMDTCTNKRLLAANSHRATFLFDLAQAITGLK